MRNAARKRSWSGAVKVGLPYRHGHVTKGVQVAGPSLVRERQPVTPATRPPRHPGRAVAWQTRAEQRRLARRVTAFADPSGEPTVEEAVAISFEERPRRSRVWSSIAPQDA